MKSALVFLLLVGVALAQTNIGARGAPSPVAPGAPAGRAGAATANPYGPRVYGMGLNNPWAILPSPFVMQRAMALINNVPGALVRVDANGEIAFTNQFGQEVDINDGFGNDLTELFD